MKHDSKFLTIKIFTKYTSLQNIILILVLLNKKHTHNLVLLLSCTAALFTVMNYFHMYKALNNLIVKLNCH